MYTKSIVFIIFLMFNYYNYINVYHTRLLLLFFESMPLKTILINIFWKIIAYSKIHNVHTILNPHE